MEEAEALGDSVLIMADGKLKAEGSSLFLKNHYGKGYQISLTGDSNTVADFSMADLEAWVLSSLPTSDIIASEGGTLTVGIQKEAVKYLSAFLKKIEEDQLFAWNVSNSTLEEVFLRLVTHSAKVTEGVTGKEMEKFCLLCVKRPAEIVTLLTSGGVKVTVGGVICSNCSFGSEETPQKNDGELISFHTYKKAIGTKQVEDVHDSLDLQLKEEVHGGRLLQIGALLRKNLAFHKKEKCTFS
jgi:hypothetical protein